MQLTLMFLQYIIVLFSVTWHLELTNNDRNFHNNIWKKSQVKLKIITSFNI